MIIKFLAPLLLACDPGLAQLFTPLHPQLGQYEVCVASASIGGASEDVRREGFHLSQMEELEPLDAFGTSGAYDRSALVRLYGGRRAKVVRGWRQTGEAFESLTLISPHPDAQMQRLAEDTLIIRWIKK